MSLPVDWEIWIGGERVEQGTDLIDAEGLQRDVAVTRVGSVAAPICSSIPIDGGSGLPKEHWWNHLESSLEADGCKTIRREAASLFMHLGLNAFELRWVPDRKTVDMYILSKEDLKRLAACALLDMASSARLRE